MLGRIAHAEGNLDLAAKEWTEAEVEGDVYNRYAGRAGDSLKAVFGLKDDKDADAAAKAAREAQDAAPAGAAPAE